MRVSCDGKCGFVCGWSSVTVASKSVGVGPDVLGPDSAGRDPRLPERSPSMRNVDVDQCKRAREGPEVSIKKTDGDT